MSRTRITSLLAAVVLLPGALGAQAPEPTPFEQRRAALTRELQETQAALSDLRSQRLRLQARVENALAASMQQRAQELLMSNEQSALAELDAMLVTAQDNLLAQRDRIAALGESIRRRTGSELAVVLRADSSQAQTIGAVEVRVNDVTTATRAYTPAANQALSLGAVDELYRADVLPTAYTVTISARVNDQPVTRTVTVNVQPQMVTYITFAVRNGQIVPLTHTSATAAPF